MPEIKTDADTDFRRRREESRRADRAALASLHTTPKILQQKNSIFPSNVRERVQIDWHNIAHGTHIRP